MGVPRDPEQEEKHGHELLLSLPGQPSLRFLDPGPSDPICIFSCHPLGGHGAIQVALTEGLSCPRRGQGRREHQALGQGLESSGNCLDGPQGRFQPQSPGKLISLLPPEGVGGNGAMAASPTEDQAGRDSCSLAGRQPAAARETGQGGAGRAQPPQAPSLSSRAWERAAASKLGFRLSRCVNGQLG